MSIHGPACLVANFEFEVMTCGGGVDSLHIYLLFFVMVLYLLPQEKTFIKMHKNCPREKHNKGDDLFYNGYTF